MNGNGKDTNEALVRMALEQEAKHYEMLSETEWRARSTKEAYGRIASAIRNLLKPVESFDVPACQLGCSVHEVCRIMGEDR